jgi:outer membrane receptor protein involved in Fe transport
LSRPSRSAVASSRSRNAALTERQNLRLSATQTLSRPEYREIAPVQYREVIGAENMIGNPNLHRSLIQNLDLRWEWYPASDEVLSVALFAKRFQNPIERVYLAQSGTAVVTFENAREAQNYGVELEARKSLAFLGERMEPFTGFTNVTLMHSEVRLDPAVGSQRNTERPMVGQAPYVVNAGVTYAPWSGATSATLLYNLIGRRIHSAAEAPLPEVYEMPRHLLDLSLRMPLRPGMAARLDARNLLDARSELRQGDVVREAYRTGRSLSVGVSVQR